MYLTEELLGTILRTIPDATVEGQWALPNTRFKYDYKVTTKDYTYFVEFDGYGHFTCPKTITRDSHKDEMLLDFIHSLEPINEEDTDACSYDEYISDKYKIIRIPYFVQLDDTMLEYYFEGTDITVGYKYPHGFIDSNAKTPDYFCYQGILKYKSVLNSLPKWVREDIKFSVIKHTAFSICNRVCVIGEDNPEHYFDVPNTIVLYEDKYPKISFDANIVKLPEYSEDLISAIRAYINVLDSAGIEDIRILSTQIKQRIPQFESFIFGLK